MTDGIHTRDGQRYLHKKDLILAVKDGEIPVLESTSIYNNYSTKPVNQLTPGVYWVVGPEPDNRKWFAEITVKQGGRIYVR